MASPSATNYFAVEAPISAKGSVASDMGVGILADSIGPSTGTTGTFVVPLVDNLADAYNIKEGSTSYLKFVTTNAGEKVVLGKQLQLDAGHAPSAVFKSAEQTGTGAPQNIAHGLTITPSLIWAVATDTTAAGVIAGGYTIVAGAHTATNAIFTVTTNAKYIVYALK